MNSEFKVKSKSEGWLLLMTVSISSLFISMNATFFNFALPAISQEFNASIPQVSWIITAHLLIIGSIMSIGGKAGDLISFRTVNIIGASIALVGSLFASLSTSLTMLISFRVVAAIGIGLMIAMGPAIATAFLPDRLRGKAMGILELFFSSGMIIGMVVGGLIATAFGWRYIFYFNVPSMLLIIIGSIAFLPKHKAQSAEFKFDYTGAALIFLSVLSLLFGLNSAPSNGWLSPKTFIPLVSFATLFLLFILRERGFSHPIVDLSLFRRVNFTISNISFFLSMLVMLGVLFIAPFYLVETRGLSSKEASMIIALPSLMLIIFCPISGYLADKWGSKSLCIAGMLIASGSCALLGTVGMYTSLSLISVYVLIMGFGYGTYIPPAASLVMGDAGLGKRGMASSIMMLTRNIGSMLGVAIFATVFQYYTTEICGQMTRKHAILAGTKVIFVISAILLLIAGLVTICAKPQPGSND